MVRPPLAIRLLAPSTESVVRINAGTFLPARVLWLKLSRK